jgi:hypothetical protein
VTWFLILFIGRLSVKIKWLPIVLAALLVGSVTAPTQEVVDREYRIKAAFLYNFALYVDWPKDAPANRGETFSIGVLGENPFGDVLDQIAMSKKVDDKKLVIHYFKTVEAYQACHILFISARPDKENPPEARLKAVLKAANESSTLIVTETRGLAEKGATINFFIEDNRVRFEINTRAAKRAHLQLKAKLLQLGKIIED